MKLARAACELVLLSFLFAPSAHAEVFCAVFKYCLYEGGPFTIRVVDQETGAPLADVHALAAWVQVGRFGEGGPVMVQDAMSGPDGVLAFPAWGPVRGTPDGFLVFKAPVITLFKPGYVLVLPASRERAIFNDASTGMNDGKMFDTARVWRFDRDGQTFQIARFRGTAEEWVKELFGNGVLVHSAGEDGSRQFYGPYMNRTQRLRDALQAIPRGNPVIDGYVSSVERDFRWLEGLRP